MCVCACARAGLSAASFAKEAADVYAYMPDAETNEEYAQVLCVCVCVCVCACARMRLCA